MVRVSFVGRVLPSVLKLTIERNQTVEIEETQGGDITISGTYTVSIHDGIIAVHVVVSDDYDEALHQPWLMIRAMDLAGAVISFISFASATGVSFVFDYYTAPSGEQRSLVLRDSDLMQISSPMYDDKKAFDEILEIACTDFRLTKHCRT